MSDQTLGVPGLLIHGTHECRFFYTNWRGEIASRRVGVMSMWFGSTEWHPEPQWLMHGIDLDKMETRDFALKDMREVTYSEWPPGKNLEQLWQVPRRTV